MSAERKPKLKRGFTGWRRDQVDQYLGRLSLAHSAEVAALRAEIQLERDRQATLQQQLDWLETQGIVPSVLSQLQASRVQAEDAGSLLTELLRWDIMDVETLAAQEHKAIEQEIEQVQAELDQAIAEYEHFLKELESLADSAGPPLSPIWDEAAAAAGTEASPAAHDDGQSSAATAEAAPVAPADSGAPGPAAATAQAAASLAPGSAAATTIPTATAAARPTVPSMPSGSPQGGSAEAARERPAATAVETGLATYLRGKRLGQDLYTPAGELIAPAGSPLSIELIERAEREGILSELVIDLDWQENDRQ